MIYSRSVVWLSLGVIIASSALGGSGQPAASPEWNAGYQAGYLDGTSEAQGILPDPVNGSSEDDVKAADYSVGYSVGFNQGYDDNFLDTISVTETIWAQGITPCSTVIQAR
jgi:hypothetical protein